jgi:hypothetical protein
MEHFLNPTVGDIVYVMREDRGGQRIPFDCRRYVNQDNYGYWARVVMLKPNKRYHRVKPLESQSAQIRKGYKSKLYYRPTV